MKLKNRNSNVELLRILSIFMIILSHYTVHNGVENNMLPISFNRLLLEIVTLGNIGVIIFILITGYFSVELKNPFKFKKLVFLYLQTLFYSLTIYLIFIAFGKEHFSIKMLIKHILPISFKNYWFISAYAILYILTPFINKYICGLERKEHLNFILVNLLIFSIFGMITTQDYYGNELIQFIIFYIIGAYLKKYRDNIFNKGNNNKIIFIITSLILILSVVIFDLLGTKILIFGKYSTYLFGRTSIISILFAISIFNIFTSKRKYSNNFINQISSAVLGVYLISDNNLVRNILWTDILKVHEYVNSNLLFIHMIVSLLIIFIVCIIVELARKNTIEKISNIMYDKVDKKHKKLCDILNKCLSKINQ